MEGSLLLGWIRPVVHFATIWRRNWVLCCWWQESQGCPVLGEAHHHRALPHCHATEARQA